MFKLQYYIPVYAALRQFAGLYNEHYLQTGVGDNLERSFKGRKKEETSKKSMELAILTLPLTSSVPSVSSIKNKTFLLLTLLCECIM